ncbi:hypothetical protein DEO72_LG10g1446 [Vigna unguiculata]|uniref:Uncharacterized protein n=1 Tax=Vigna unguiculata TaxID=3917 RepID=A0A4D6NCF9_VIGUN|nr:hypothetical protein DEO72_LG10g1446 [Vigna unguiculata]
MPKPVEQHYGYNTLRLTSVCDRTSKGVPAPRGAWRQGVLCQAIDLKIVHLDRAWRLVTRLFRQAVCTGFVWGYEQGRTTNGEVRRAGLRAGRFIEAGPRAAIGGGAVIGTGAVVITGGVGVVDDG